MVYYLASEVTPSYGSPHTANASNRHNSDPGHVACVISRTLNSLTVMLNKHSVLAAGGGGISALVGGETWPVTAFAGLYAAGRRECARHPAGGDTRLVVGRGGLDFVHDLNFAPRDFSVFSQPDNVLGIIG